MNLAELIEKVRAERGWDLKTIGERLAAVDGGSWQRIYNLANPTLGRFPEKRTVRPLAHALDVPLKTVTDAILRSLDLIEDDGSSLSGENVVVISTESLTPEEREHIRETAQKVVATMESAMTKPLRQEQIQAVINRQARNTDA